MVLRAGDRRVVVSGDVSGPDDEYLSVDGLHLPHGLVHGADLLVIESTYCHADHNSREAQTGELVRQIKTIVEGRGRVLIPAFGLGRSQEIAMIVARELPDVDVLLDGLAREISAIYEKAADMEGTKCEIFTSRVRRVENRFREIQSFRSGVVIASSGMLTGGASVQWAKSILPDQNAALLLCGYQDEEAPGRRLENLTHVSGRKTLRLPDDELGMEDVEVRATVRKYNLSAHADRSGLTSIVQQIAPVTTMLVHGEPHHQTEYRNELRRASLPTVQTGRWTS